MYQAGQVVTIDHRFVRAQATAGLHPLHQRTVMRTIGGHHWTTQPHGAPAQLQRHKVHADDHHPFPAAKRMIKVGKALDIKPFFDPFVAPEPGHAGFNQPHSQRHKVLIDQGLARRRRHLREAEFNIAPGDMFAAFEKTSGKTTRAGADKMQQRIRQLYNQPEDAEPKPGQPVARV